MEIHIITNTSKIRLFLFIFLLHYSCTRKKTKTEETPASPISALFYFG